MRLTGCRNNRLFAISRTVAGSRKYTIDTKGLKDGSYTLAFWQEKYQDLGTQKIDVKGGKATADLKYKPTGGKAQAPQYKTIHLASASGAPACCADKRGKTAVAKSN